MAIQAIYLTTERNPYFDFVNFGVDPMSILIPAATVEVRLLSCAKPFSNLVMFFLSFCCLVFILK